MTMKFKMLAAGILLASTSVVATAESKAVELADEKQKLSYGLGIILGERLKADFDSLDINALAKGVEDSIQGKEPAIPQKELMALIQKAQQEKAQVAQKEYTAKAEANRKRGDDFLKENAKKDGVKSTDSGLQYKVLNAGNGEKPKAENTVVVHYEGRTLNGDIFDSSYERKEPASFGVKQVIPGWTEALQLMAKGSKWELYIPSKLAYGPGGFPPKIGPNELLVFKVELVDIKK